MNLAVRRPSRRRLGVAAVVLLLAGMLASFVVASAAQLNLGSVARQHAEVKERCDADGVALTTPSVGGATTRIDVSGIHANCSGKPIVVQLSTGGSTNFVASGSVPSAAGSVQLASGTAYTPGNVARVSVTIDGWPTSATWTYTPVAILTWCRVETLVGGSWQEIPSASCAVTNLTPGSSWGSPVDHRQLNVSYTFSGVPTGSNHRLVSQVDLSQFVTLGSGQAWSSTSISGWGVDVASPLPLARFNYGNSQSGSGSFTSQITIES